MSFIQSDVVKGGKKSGRGRRRSREEEGNQGVGDFRFINILSSFTLNTLLYHIFSILFLTHDIYPHPHPHPRPTPTTYDI